MIVVSGGLRLEVGMSNSSDPQQSGEARQATVLVIDADPTLQTLILDLVTASERPRPPPA
jgi:hypothetical protein